MWLNNHLTTEWQLKSVESPTGLRLSVSLGSVSSWYSRVAKVSCDAIGCRHRKLMTVVRVTVPHRALTAPRRVASLKSLSGYPHCGRRGPRRFVGLERIGRLQRNGLGACRRWSRKSFRKISPRRTERRRHSDPMSVRVGGGWARMRPEEAGSKDRARELEPYWPAPNPDYYNWARGNSQKFGGCSIRGNSLEVCPARDFELAHLNVLCIRRRTIDLSQILKMISDWLIIS